MCLGCGTVRRWRLGAGRGYWFVQDGVILGLKTAGGRDEAGVITIKRFGENLKELHVEVGTLPCGAQRDLETIERKLRKRDALISYVGERLGEEEFSHLCFTDLYC